MNNTDISVLHQQALWRSRRGMLELDLLFRPFAEACFEKLSGELQLVFVEMLECDDFELLDLTRQPEQISRYTTLIHMVLQFRKTGEIVDPKPSL